MKKPSTIALILLMSAAAAFSQNHPQAAIIKAYMDANPMDPRVSDILAGISDSSMKFNRDGYYAYADKRWDEALEQFRAAISEDDDNCFAYFNYACTLALKYSEMDYTEYDSYDVHLTIVRYLKQAIERDWYFALKTMWDPDLDSVRYFDIGMPGWYVTVSEDEEWGNVNNVLVGDGAASNEFYGGGMEVVSDGWYCIVADYVFEYFPAAITRAGFPESENLTYFFPFSDFELGEYSASSVPYDGP